PSPSLCTAKPTRLLPRLLRRQEGRVSARPFLHGLYVLPMPPVFRSSEFHPGDARGVLLSTAVPLVAAQARSPPCVFLPAPCDRARRPHSDRHHAVFATNICSYVTSHSRVITARRVPFIVVKLCHRVYQ